MPSRLATGLVLLTLLSLVAPLGAVAQDGTGFPLRPQVAQTGDVTPDFQVRGSGWGHGVGMSQFGAYAMARQGHTVEQIFSHYYPGTQLGTDDRADRRIRVGIQPGIPHSIGVASSWVSNPSGNQPLAWRACTPPDGVTTSRVPHEHCQDLAVQPPNTSWRVCPDGGGLKVVSARAEENAQGCLGEALHTTAAPILRLLHDGQVITSPWHSSGTQRYKHGFRDFHVRPGGVLHVVQDVPTVNIYLRGLAEMPSSWGLVGPAALDAQAITGRTYAIRRLAAPRGASCSCDILASPSDQHYTGWAKESEGTNAHFGEIWVQAVDRTGNQVLHHGTVLAETYYSSSHGLGRSENIEDSWAYGTTPVPYLRSVEDPWSLDPQVSNPMRSWTRAVRHAAFTAFISSAHTRAFSRIERVRVLDRTDGRTPIRLEVTGITSAGRETIIFTGGGKNIAGANMRLRLRDADNRTLPGSQIQQIGFGPFIDDDGNVHEYAITWANRAGIADGVNATTFRPNASVNRGQMASFIFRTFAIPDATQRDRFPDVDPGSAHAHAIDSLAEAGVVSGFPDGNFRPSEPVTRAQMATFIAKAAGLNTSDTSTPFQDVSSSDTHAGAIGAVARAGITTGCTPDRYCPRDPVTRGQMATFLHRTARR